jgi:hypothetical protein
MWPGVPGKGAAIILGGRERDCIFEEEHVIHYLEVTSNPKLEKVEKDVEKMVLYRENMIRQGQPVKLWIVTLDEPSPHQQAICKKHGISILSFIQFRRHIIDADKYIELRKNYPFGSATDPKNDSSNLSKIAFQPVYIRNENTGNDLSLTEVADLLVNGHHILLLGDYGMGKSINIWALFRELRKRYFDSHGSSPIPVVLNLRDHWGQKAPHEALTRHAEEIGFSPPSQLVRAFNAGRLIVLLDGFDEISGIPWTLKTKELRHFRRNAVQLVRNFTDSASGKSGLLIAGRQHFFDSREELKTALGIGDKGIVLSVNEFTDDEAHDFLEKLQVAATLPEWLPKRPLLLASLAARDLLEGIAEQEVRDIDLALAWDKLVDIVCKREARIHQGYLDANGIRSILENLASESRSTDDSLGPITEDHIAEAFRAEVGAYPDETARALLQRLPGLAARNSQDGTRSFLDDNLLDVLRAGAVVRFIENPYLNPTASKWKHGLGQLGAQVASTKLSNPSAQENMLTKIIHAAREATTRWQASTLGLDQILVAQNFMPDNAYLDCGNFTISEATCDSLNLFDLPFPTSLCLKDSLISELLLPAEEKEGLILKNCMIEQVVGAANAQALPLWIQNCDIGAFEILPNAKILADSSQPLPVRVLVVALRRLYRQKGSGRRENAFYRGLDTKARKYVPDILHIIRQEHLAFRAIHAGSPVWHTVTGQSRRAITIIDSGGRSSDPTVVAARKLTGK